MGDQRYTPTVGDIDFSTAEKKEINPFETAVLLRNISDEYLAVLVHDNSGPDASGFKAMIDFEVQRRGLVVAQRANQIAKLSLGFSVLAILVSGLSIWL